MRLFPVLSLSLIIAGIFTYLAVAPVEARPRLFRGAAGCSGAMGCGGVELSQVPQRTFIVEAVVAAPVPALPAAPIAVEPPMERTDEPEIVIVNPPIESTELARGPAVRIVAGVGGKARGAARVVARAPVRAVGRIREARPARRLVGRLFGRRGGC